MGIVMLTDDEYQDALAHFGILGFKKYISDNLEVDLRYLLNEFSRDTWVSNVRFRDQVLGEPIRSSVVESPRLNIPLPIMSFSEPNKVKLDVGCSDKEVSWVNGYMQSLMSHKPLIPRVAYCGDLTIQCRVSQKQALQIAAHDVFIREFTYELSSAEDIAMNLIFDNADRLHIQIVRYEEPTCPQRVLPSTLRRLSNIFTKLAQKSG